MHCLTLSISFVPLLTYPLTTTYHPRNSSPLRLIISSFTRFHSHHHHLFLFLPHHLSTHAAVLGPRPIQLMAVEWTPPPVVVSPTVQGLLGRGRVLGVGGPKGGRFQRRTGTNAVSTHGNNHPYDITTSWMLHP